MIDRCDSCGSFTIYAFDNVPFLPRNFLGDPEGKDIQVVYAPFWLYPASVTGHYEYKAETVGIVGAAVRADSTGKDTGRRPLNRAAGSTIPCRGADKAG